MNGNRVQQRPIEACIKSLIHLRKIVEGLLAYDQMRTVQLSELLTNDAAHLRLPEVHLGRAHVTGLSAARLVADFVVDVVELARLLDDLASKRCLTADDLIVLERSVLRPLHRADTLQVVLVAQGIQRPDAIGICVTEEGQLNHDPIIRCQREKLMETVKKHRIPAVQIVLRFAVHRLAWTRARPGRDVVRRLRLHRG